MSDTIEQTRFRETPSSDANPQLAATSRAPTDLERDVLMQAFTEFMNTGDVAPRWFARLNFLDRLFGHPSSTR
jgi:hypothetical protein